MRVVVTGGAGFLGSTLTDRLLAEGHSVDVVDDLSTGRLANLAEARADRRHALSFHQLDATTPAMGGLLGRRRPEVVYHLVAAAPGAQPAARAGAVVVSLLQVLAGAVAAEVAKVVVVVGAEVYGPLRAADRPVRESHTMAPCTVEGLLYRSVLDLLALHREQHQLEFTALVLDLAYGPRQARPWSPELAGPGVDPVFADDVVDALVRAATRGGGLVCNIGNGVVLDATRASIHLGWAPWTSLEQGLAALRRWERTGAGG